MGGRGLEAGPCRDGICVRISWPPDPSLPAPSSRPACREKRQLGEELQGRERVLEGLGRDLSRGLNSVKRLTQELGLEGQVGWWKKSCEPAAMQACGLPCCSRVRPRVAHEPATAGIPAGGAPFQDLTLPHAHAVCVLPQVYGTLIELFDCRKELYTATEVVANNSLFHVVVSAAHAAELG